MTTYYVSASTGSDSNAGTSSGSALSTLQAAADLVQPGDTVDIMNGTYTGPGYGDVVDITTSGTQSAPITFEAAPGQTPVIDSSGTWNAVNIEASYITVSGLTVVGDAAQFTQADALANESTGNAELDGNGIVVTSPDGVFIPNHITIENNTVYDEPGGGIIANNADYVQILNNIVHDNAHWSAYGNSGISVGGATNTDTLPGNHFIIEGNTSYNNTELVPEYRAGAITDGEGIILDTNPGFTGGFLVQGNTTYGNSGPGIESFLSDNATITGNTVGGDLTNPSVVSEGEIFINQSANNVVTDNPVSSSPPTSPTPSSPPTTESTNEFVLYVAEDAYDGDANFTVQVDGQQVGGTYTATALNSLGQTQAVPIDAELASGTNTVSVTFTNDASGPAVPGSTSTDRNLFVVGATYNGQIIPDAADALFSNGSDNFTVTPSTTSGATGSSTTGSSTTGSSTTGGSTTGGSTTGSSTTGSSTTGSSTTTGSAITHTLILNVSEDAYQGNAQFTVQVDGTQVGEVYTATALHSQGASQSIDLGTFSDGSQPHDVSVDFLNDAYGGSPSMDRNLYVDSIQIDGQTVPGTTAALMSAGAQDFVLPVEHQLVLGVSEDAYQGDAQFTVQVNGVPIGGTYTATALHSSGQTQAVNLGEILGSASPYDVAVTFLNDAYGGTPSTDRNLYVDAIQVDGQTVPGTTAALMSAGTDHFAITVPLT